MAECPNNGASFARLIVAHSPNWEVWVMSESESITENQESITMN